MTFDFNSLRPPAHSSIYDSIREIQKLFVGPNHYPTCTKRHDSGSRMLHLAPRVQTHVCYLHNELWSRGATSARSGATMRAKFRARVVIDAPRFPFVTRTMCIRYTGNRRAIRWKRARGNVRKATRFPNVAAVGILRSQLV